MKGLSIKDLIKSLKSGDASPLQYVFEECGYYCTSTLRNKTGCTHEDAEDHFVDAVMIFRDNILKGSLKELSNLKSYLFGICLNLQRQQSRANQKLVHAPDQSVEALFFQDIMEDPMTDGIEGEFSQELLQTCMETLELLTNNCKTILEDFYVFGLNMTEIATKLNLSNANVAKTTKLRCYKKWRELINTHYTSPSM